MELKDVFEKLKRFFERVDKNNNQIYDEKIIDVSRDKYNFNDELVKLRRR